VPPHRLLHDSTRVWQVFIVVGVGQPPVRYDAIDLGLSLPLDVHVLHHREEKDQERGMCLRVRLVARMEQRTLTAYGFDSSCRSKSVTSAQMRSVELTEEKLANHPFGVFVVLGRCARFLPLELEE
jgi:hypothetical protein